MNVYVYLPLVNGTNKQGYCVISSLCEIEVVFFIRLFFLTLHGGTGIAVGTGTPDPLSVGIPLKSNNKNTINTQTH